MVLHSLEFDVRPKAICGPKAKRQFLRCADGEPLAPSGAAPFQHDAAVLGPHSDEKAVRAAATAAIRLKRTFHQDSRQGVVVDTRRNTDRSERMKSKSNDLMLW